MPNIDMPSTNTPAEAMAMVRMPKSDSGISGSTARRSAQMNADERQRWPAPAAAARVGSVHPASVTWLSASSSGTIQPVSVTSPSQSMVRLLPCGGTNGKVR